MISSYIVTLAYLAIANLSFQSRNRGSFDFKFEPKTNQEGLSLSFQSRNRGSFDFKSAPSGGLTVRAFSDGDSARDELGDARR